MANIIGDSSNPQLAAILGKHSTQGIGVQAESAEKWAIRAIAPRDTAIFSTSEVGIGVDARSITNTGVNAFSERGVGIWAESAEKWAIRANAPKDTAIFATSEMGRGIDVRSTSGVGIYAEGNVAGYFQGNIVVTGDVQLQNADCAEEFDVLAPEAIEPGMLMVIGSEGKLCQSTKAYDKRVAGVVSGASSLKPGLLLDKATEPGDRLPIALMGKVYCKVDASFGAIEVGDLLTTSDTPGHAMKASDPAKAFGAVIGKALEQLDTGRGLIPVLVTLQ